jgi:small GTP-binding protein
MLRRILDEVRHEILRDERRLLGDLRVVLVREGAPAESQKALVRSISQLDELFMLVVAGEFNAGKSAVINALLGDRVLEEGPTPTTARIALLKYGPAESRTQAGNHEAIMLPFPILREISIVDTPGTNAVLREHEALTREFVPRADLVLFVTSADRPFTESERQFLEAIQSWGKKVVVAVNKVDILETPEDVTKVVDFVREKTLALLGLRPQVFAVSAREARKAKADGQERDWRESGFPALESFVTSTLHEAVRLRLKLLNPLGVGLKGLGEAEQAGASRLAAFKEDQALLEATDAELAAHREDLVRGARLRLAEVEKAVFDFEKRGRDFLDDTLRLRAASRLLSPTRVGTEYEREVVGDLPRVVEKRVDEIGAWMAGQKLAHWKGVAERLARRRAVHGQGPGASDYDPSTPPADIRREAQRALETFDTRDAARRLAAQARGAVLTTVLAQAGAIGLALATLLLASTPASTASGLALAAVLSAGGFLLLPFRRRRARLDLGEKTTALREALTSRLRARLEREADQDRQRALEAIAPYRRFVRSEGERLERQREELAAVRRALLALKARIESL